MLLADGFEYLHSAHARHAYVEEHQIQRLVPYAIERLWAVFGNQHRESLTFQAAGQHVTVGFFVVHNE